MIRISEAKNSPKKQKKKLRTQMENLIISIVQMRINKNISLELLFKNYKK
jgi:hypothetical protein